MTLLPFSNIKTDTNLITKNALALLVVLLLFLLSTLVHATHLTDELNHEEQQTCYICHQGIDTPPELPKIQISLASNISNEIYVEVTPFFDTNSYFLPLLRAPPEII